MKKKIIILLWFAAVVLCCSCTLAVGGEQAAGGNPDMKLWYDNPAQLWVEALPLGNGRLGAMVYGGAEHDELQLNEETIWGGSPHNNTNPKAKEYLSEIRRLIFEDRNMEAQELSGIAISSQGANGMPYQTVGSIHLDFDGIGEYTDYYRELDISTAVSRTRFFSDGIEYTREYFTSFPDQVVVVRLTASQPGSLSFTTRYTTPYKEYELSGGSDYIRLDAKSNDHEGIEGKVRFAAISKVVADGGTVSPGEENTVRVENANSAIVYISIGTNFVNYKDISGDGEAMAMGNLDKAVVRPYEEMLSDHVEFYSKYFNRASLNLGRTSQADKPTDVRVAEFASSFDPALAALYFQFGRYLLICSSQPGGQAANLQGIWNYQLRAPWDGKYTSDINVEMNYWPAEATSLPEMHEPLLRLIREVAVTGRESARMYGCRGWTLHHNTDIWRTTGSVDGPAWGIWPTCNAWFCQHLWDSFLFSGDERFLAGIYPLMKEACEFYLDFLVEEPKNNWLVVSPSYSPENKPTVDGKRTPWVVTAGTTMDNQMVYDLFYNTISAAGLVGENGMFIDSLRTTMSRLAPIQIGSWGQLQEWMEDWDGPRDRHRHLSHLWGLYPGYQISKYHTPELFSAARTSLEARGDHSTGWSMGWKVCLWSRLLDGDRAYKLLQEQISPTSDEKGQNGGTYPNLFDAHPPFQIDGNFGCAAGIGEMFVQSHNGAVHILPALPAVWESGEVKGIRCRGGFLVEELSWKEGKVDKLVVRSNLGGVLRLRSADELKRTGGKIAASKGESPNPLLQVQYVKEPLVSPLAPEFESGEVNGTYLYDIPTEKGKVYTFYSI